MSLMFVTQNCHFIQ